ncbi:carbohydrate kinase [Sphingobacterium psychroaquaticum]|uniref:xylulokinase n=1 Tax=Sphingobacterium psychroaquaticum TaxID=561061 RepID=UPI0010698459|nr:FGGY family carbohydrate kinase [Sphingobacterium psychroaquaticum]QBQ41560.1 carbohydrate kinase [Sphingobacterium psychroaquaticum]
MLLLGIDLGTSSVKVSVVDAETQLCLASATYPEKEAEIISLKPDWAEQNPNLWWSYTQEAIRKVNASQTYNPKDIQAIGIAYQMHGLVVVDKDHKVLRDAIIWCDSRAVETGNKAMTELEPTGFLHSHLNSPGNFTASKLAWVKENEPALYAQIYKFMLPGDFLSMCFTGHITTNPSALSEGVLWNFEQNRLSTELLSYYGVDEALVPTINPVFSNYGYVTKDVAQALGFGAHVVVTYKAGDQPNNALSLNVRKPGEVAATGGTSGVIYAVDDHLIYDKASRVNTFAHVNHSKSAVNVGVLLCINGTGIQNSWIRKITGIDVDYATMNAQAGEVAIGADGLRMLPFGNGAERMLGNRTLGGSMEHLDFVRHTPAHLWRAAQEGIAFSFRYGLDILRENGLSPTVIRAGHTNLFLSPLFRSAFVDVTGIPVELYNNDGSVGAALGAGIGAQVFSDQEEAFNGLKKVLAVEVSSNADAYEALYQEWKLILDYKLSN